jgi:hypothetical protein
MATQPIASVSLHSALQLQKIATFPHLRVLTWDGDILYASRGYELLRARATAVSLEWCAVGRCRPEWWRQLTCRSKLGYRLVRDGFHALAVHASGDLIAVIPGAIATLRAGEEEFRVTHCIQRGTRPLHITVTPEGRVYWGEYFDNATREEVHIYASDDGGYHWSMAHTFPKGSIRHVHNIVYDGWRKCLWIFTGDYGRECRILRATLDLTSIEEVIAGTQRARAVAAIVNEDGLFFASDTPLERNYIYKLDPSGLVEECSAISSSSIYGCQNLSGMFFSTMVEPSPVNRSRMVTLMGSTNGESWNEVDHWTKDAWSMKYFQYGNAFLPDGANSTDLLALSTVAVEGADLTTSIWKTSTV